MRFASRCIRRYMCAAITLASLIWLCKGLLNIATYNDVKYSEEKSQELVNIDYFKIHYKTMLDPQPGTAGMEGDAVINPDSEKEKEDVGLNDYGFNELSSSKISLERTIPDNRHKSCFNIKYPKDLQTASVIIIFHNEAWSALLRTVHTVLARSPPHMIYEIILVDDSSINEQLVRADGLLPPAQMVLKQNSPNN